MIQTCKLISNITCTNLFKAQESPNEQTETKTKLNRKTKPNKIQSKTESKPKTEPKADRKRVIKKR